MADNNINDKPLVMHDSQGFNWHLLIVEWYGHKALEYGVKYNLTLVSPTIFIDKYSCLSFILRTLLKNHLFLINVIFLVVLKKYILSSVLHVPFKNDAALPF